MMRGGVRVEQNLRPAGRWRIAAVVIALLASGVVGSPCRALPEVRIGSKRFTESYILGEIAVQVARASGEVAPVQRPGLGNTVVVYRALRQGSINLYPEYTGTIAEAILKQPGLTNLGAMRLALAAKGLVMGPRLGFSDNYGLAVTAAMQQKLGLRRISDLLQHPDLRMGLSHEFLARPDGYPGLKARYGLAMDNIRGLDHGLAYEALANGQIDVTDVYTTDAEIKKYNLRVLEDDLHFFPIYDGVFLFRQSVPRQFPRFFAMMNDLKGRISTASMIDMNSQAEVQHRSFSAIARQFAATRLHLHVAPAGASVSPTAAYAASVWKLGRQHLFLVTVSMAFAVLFGIPLGILAERSRLLAQTVLSITGLIQTIPSLALLCFMIPTLGIGTRPALVALFLYSLLPIVRNTYTGLQEIPPSLRESAEALGLSPAAQLWQIRLPMASRMILAGIKTAAVVNVGTATIAALIGAGGFGEPIVTGLALNDIPTIMRGAIPAALLALAVQGVFDLLDLVLIPRGLRLSPSNER